MHTVERKLDNKEKSLPMPQKTINPVEINRWLAQNTRNMKAATIMAPAWWYDGSDGTCSA